MTRIICWNCPYCGMELTCEEDEDSYDVRFDSRTAGGYVTFHHCNAWRKARITSIEEVQ